MDDRTRELVQRLRVAEDDTSELIDELDSMSMGIAHRASVSLDWHLRQSLAAADLIEEQDAKLTAIREWVKAHNYTDVSKVWEIRRILDGLAEREEQ